MIVNCSTHRVDTGVIGDRTVHEMCASNALDARCVVCEPTTLPVSVLLGVPIDVVTMDEALDQMVRLVHWGRRDQRHHQVVTVNVDFLRNARFDAELRSVLRSSHFAIADGMPLVWASKLLNAPLPERVAGSDLVPLLAARAAEEDLSMVLFGAGPGVADRAAGMLREKHPLLRVHGFSGPYFERIEDMDPAVLDELRSLAPDILCVALGHPKQDKWIHRYGPELGIPVMIGVGGTLDFLAGDMRRAPRWMQRVGLEWFFRLAQEPRRLAGRYSRDLVHFAPRVLAQRMAMPRDRRHLSAPPSLGQVPVTVLDEGAATTVPLESLAVLSTARPGTRAVLDLADLGKPTWQAVLAIVGLARRVRSSGGELFATAEVHTSPSAWRWYQHLDGFLPLLPPTGRTAQIVKPTGAGVVERSITIPGSGLGSRCGAVELSVPEPRP